MRYCVYSKPALVTLTGLFPPSCPELLPSYSSPPGPNCIYLTSPLLETAALSLAFMPLGAFVFVLRLCYLSSITLSTKLLECCWGLQFSGTIGRWWNYLKLSETFFFFKSLFVKKRMKCWEHVYYFASGGKYYAKQQIWHNNNSLRFCKLV